MLHRRIRLAIAVGALALTAALPSPALAQGGVDLSGGYAHLYDYDLGSSLATGWFGAVGIDIVDGFGLAGEVTRGSRSLTESFGGIRASASLSVTSVMAGPRFSAGSNRVRAYAQLMIGASRASARARGRVSGISIDASESVTAYAVQPGGGIDLMLTRSVGMRVGANVRLLRADDTVSSEFQTVIGVVLRPGR
jgi:hypothetical protein